MTDGALDTAAVVAHEMYLAYTRAGFDAEQALRIVIALVTNGRQQKPEAEQ